MLQNIALALLGIGTIILVGWGVKEFLAASDIPLFIKIAVLAVGAGILILLGIAIRDRRKKSKTDDFKGVER